MGNAYMMYVCMYGGPLEIFEIVSLSTDWTRTTDLHVAFKIERKKGKQKIWSCCLLYKYTYTHVSYLVLLVS